ncbi:MAG TPA: (Fe-S)-binding protein [Steroidobacteraceae bacterium]
MNTTANAAEELAAFKKLAQGIAQLASAAPPVDLPAAERVTRAKHVFIQKIDAQVALDLESCLHCGMCAEACHFYEGTGQGRYAPIHKLKLLRKVYRRELGPFRLVHRLLTRDLTAAELEQWQELVFDSCTECGRCDMICPVGVHLSRGVHITRQALAAAGLAPAELRALDAEQKRTGAIFGAGVELLRSALDTLRAQGIQAPLDKPRADYLVLTTAPDLLIYRSSIAATARIMNHLGVDWTFASNAFEAANSGALSGDEAAQRQATQRIVDAALACGAKFVVVPECGHAYPALRWEGPNAIGRDFPFEVLAISELLGREIDSGRLRLKPLAPGKRVTFHDPCKLGRKGGVFDEPRKALAALGVELRETASKGTTNYCCGGGAGVFLIGRAAPLRAAAFRIKRDQFDATGAESVVTSCQSCRMSFAAGAQQNNWNVPVESLVELVANNLAAPETTRGPTT